MVLDKIGVFDEKYCYFALKVYHNIGFHDKCELFHRKLVKIAKITGKILLQASYLLVINNSLQSQEFFPSTFGCDNSKSHHS
jgi:hypothetical protein